MTGHVRVGLDLARVFDGVQEVVQVRPPLREALANRVGCGVATAANRLLNPFAGIDGVLRWCIFVT